MATPLTDGINALTAYANEVTGASDTNLSDAVETLVAGYGGESSANYLNYATRIGGLFLNANNLPAKIEFTPQLSGGNNNGDFLGTARDAENSGIELIIHLTQTTAFSLNRLLFNAYGVKKLCLTGNLNLCTSYMNILNGANAVEEIDAIFDFTACAGTNDCVVNSSGTRNSILKELRFAPNTCQQNLNISGFSALSDASLVSAGNCLANSISGKTMTLYSVLKTRCSTLMGNNVDGLFVADENGTMSLADFITNVKGWTLV